MLSPEMGHGHSHGKCEEEEEKEEQNGSSRPRLAGGGGSRNRLRRAFRSTGSKNELRKCIKQEQFSGIVRITLFSVSSSTACCQQGKIIIFLIGRLDEMTISFSVVPLLEKVSHRENIKRALWYKMCFLVIRTFGIQPIQILYRVIGLLKHVFGLRRNWRIVRKLTVLRL